jgi:hypothetical protein
VSQLKPQDRQAAYYRLARTWLKDRKDPGNAMMLVNRALDISFHPTIAELKVEILLDQKLLNLADGELGRIRPWLARMSRENQAQYHWLVAQVQLARLAAGEAGPAARARARRELRRYLALNPSGPKDKIAQAQAALASLK